MIEKAIAKIRKKKLNVKKKVKLKRPKPPASIVIDSDLGLVFSSEEEMLNYFSPRIQSLVSQYQDLKDIQEIPLESVENLEELLNACLDDPDEVWMLLEGKETKENVFSFIRHHVDQGVFHVALCHVTSQDEPSFVYFHFLTKNSKTVEVYRNGRMVFDQALTEIEFGMIDGDALSEGDSLSVGLFHAMLKLRSDNDIKPEKFLEIGLECRDKTIEEADEIWRSQDSSGQVLVTFIREFSEHHLSELFYVVVTLQEADTGVHALLYSFPTQDEALVERYRYGDNLQAEEVAQESSH